MPSLDEFTAARESWNLNVMLKWPPRGYAECNPHASDAHIAAVVAMTLDQKTVWHESFRHEPNLMAWTRQNFQETKALATFMMLYGVAVENMPASMRIVVEGYL